MCIKQYINIEKVKSAIEKVKSANKTNPVEVITKNVCQEKKKLKIYAKKATKL